MNSKYDGRKKEFQLLLEKPTTTPEEIGERVKAISNLIDDFVSKATPIAKKIIMERNLPDEKKEIPPMQIGGIAGGKKYFVEGMFCKFAVDESGIYGDAENAAKPANHELRSLKEIISCHIDNLHVPLMILISYLGCRLIVNSIIPIGPETLIYGSSNVGIDVKKEDEKFNEMMKNLATKLNLKEHYVGRGFTRKLLHTCCDIEGKNQFYLTTLNPNFAIQNNKKGTSLWMEGKLEFYNSFQVKLTLKLNRYYILDCARLFPPTTPVKGIQCVHLFRLLRPEFVKKYKKPLSSDAFSSFATGEVVKENQEATEATKHLKKEVIPNFAKELNRRYAETSIEGLNLVEELHFSGINCRYLGMLRKHLIPKVDTVVLTEMIVRTSVKLLSRKMREFEIVQPDIDFYIQAAVSFFNLLFGKKRESQDFWFGEFKRKIHEKFTQAFFSHEAQPNYDLRSVVDMWQVFQLLSAKTGVVFNEDTKKRVKQVLLKRRIEERSSFIESSPSKSLSKSSPVKLNPVKEEVEMWEEDILSLKDVVEIVPIIKTIKIDTVFESLRSEGRFTEVESIYKKKLEIRKASLHPSDPHVIDAMKHLAQLYVTEGKYEEAQEIYLQILQTCEEYCPNDKQRISGCYQLLGAIAQKFGKFEDVNNFTLVFFFPF